MTIFVIARVTIFFILSLTAFGGVLNTYVDSTRATSKESSGFFIKENYMEEVWKDIPGFEGKYQASNYGQIKSLVRKVRQWRGTRTVREKILKQANITGGYQAVSLGHKTIFTVHRLVANTFISNPENKPCVNHKNGNKSDNHIYNLEWCTYSENEKHSHSVLGKKNTIHTQGVTPVNAKRVVRIDKSGNVLSVHDSIRQAAKFYGLTTIYVQWRCHNKVKKTGKYNFMFSEQQRIKAMQILKGIN